MAEPSEHSGTEACYVFQWVKCDATTLSFFVFRTFLTNMPNPINALYISGTMGGEYPVAIETDAECLDPPSNCQT